MEKIYILCGKLTIKYFKLEKWDVTQNQNKYLKSKSQASEIEIFMYI